MTQLQLSIVYKYVTKTKQLRLNHSTIFFSFCNEILSELESELEKIKNNTTTDILSRSEQSVKLCQKTIATVKERLRQISFTSQKDEIKFFKELKPLFVSKLIYHLNVYNIES